MRVLGLRRCKVGERKVGQVICNFQLADINPQHFAPLRHLMCQRAGGRPGPGFQGFQGGSKVRWGARACGLKQVAAKLHYSRATPIKMLRRYWEINPAKKSICDWLTIRKVESSAVFCLSIIHNWVTIVVNFGLYACGKFLGCLNSAGRFGRYKKRDLMWCTLK